MRGAIKNLLNRRGRVREDLNVGDRPPGDDKFPDFDGRVGKGVHFGVVIGGLASEGDPNTEDYVSFKETQKTVACATVDPVRTVSENNESGRIGKGFKKKNIMFRNERRAVFFIARSGVKKKVTDERKGKGSEGVRGVMRMERFRALSVRTNRTSKRNKV